MADVEIEGVLIPKGTTLMIVPQLTHSNPRVWGKDADDFRPERWEHLEGDAATPFAMEAFINGPRVCPYVTHDSLHAIYQILLGCLDSANFCVGFVVGKASPSS